MGYHHDLVLYQCITPLHVGCGQDVGVLDLPVIRERTTGFPYIPGSGSRGALRRRIAGSRDENRGLASCLFGPDVKTAVLQPFAGSVSVHDSKLLLFPVRSDRELFFWLTCPSAVARLAREREVFTPTASLEGSHFPNLDDDTFLGPKSLGTTSSDAIYLEEYLYRPASDEASDENRAAFAAWADNLAQVLLRPEMARRILLVNDRAFYHFCRYSTVIQQRNRLSSAKTVEDGALFSVEAVPPEAVFFGFLGGTRLRAAVAWERGTSESLSTRSESGLGDGGEPLSDPGEGTPEPVPEDTDDGGTKTDGTDACPPHLWGRTLDGREVLNELWKALRAEGEQPRALPGVPENLYLHLGGDESTGSGVTHLIRVGETETSSAPKAEASGETSKEEAA